MGDREENVYKAKLAEQAERYEEMVENMQKVAQNYEVELTVEERNLLSVAYKNVIGAKRASWRILSSLEQKEEDKKEDKKEKNMLQLIKGYKAKIEEELSEVCKAVTSLLDEHLIPHANSGESKVFYYKIEVESRQCILGLLSAKALATGAISCEKHNPFPDDKILDCSNLKDAEDDKPKKGDYKRYMAEFQIGLSRKEAAEQALIAYKAATEYAMSELPSTHPIRLGLALNFSVFYYEILNSSDRACRLAKAAFDDAIAELDTLSDDSYKDSTLIMQLLRDNLTLWTSDLSQGEDMEGSKEELEDIEQKQDTS